MSIALSPPRRITAGALGREAAAAVAQRNHEPPWLFEQRMSAWETADQLDFPTSRERAWKYLDPDALHIEGGPATALSVKYSGLSAEAQAAGVVFTSLDEAVKSHPDLVHRHLGSVVRADESVFTAINMAMWGQGAFVYVPKNVKVADVLQVTTTAGGRPGVLFPRLLVIVERGGELTLIDEHSGSEGALFAASVTEIVLMDDAKLNHFAIETWGASTQEVFVTRAAIGGGAELKTMTAGLGGSVYKGWIECALRGSGSRSEVLGALFGTGDQVFDVVTLQDHIGDHSASDLLIKAALKDQSQSSYYGLTRINPTGRMSDANQEDRNLLLSSEAKANADPVLEILTSEVARCGHGASAGPVDQEQLFYLECRGLPRAEAEKLLVQGFLGEVLERVPVESVRDTIEQAVLAKLG